MMQCPIDNTELKISDRQGIEIDYCPQCRGVWLDRGEIDKIIERSGQFSQSRSDQYDASQDSQRKNRNDNNDEEGGFLNNIFGGFGGGDD